MTNSWQKGFGIEDQCFFFDRWNNQCIDNNEINEASRNDKIHHQFKSAKKNLNKDKFMAEAHEI